MNLLKNKAKRRKAQMVSVMNLGIAFVIVVVVGVFSFELTRYLLARDELRTNVEVAALSCQTTLASSGDPTFPDYQTAAEKTALQLFQQNSILGVPMSQAILASPGSGTVDLGPGQSAISFQFLDPLTRQPVNASGAGVFGGPIDPSLAGTLVQATGSYCYSPLLGQFLNLANAQFVFSVSALAGIPKIDLMVLLDISGNMDDDTSVTYYQRYEGPSGINYMIPNSPTGPGGIAVGLNTTVWCNNTRPPNILPPCELELSGGCLQYVNNPTVNPSNGLDDGGSGWPPAPYCPSGSTNNASWMIPVDNSRQIASGHVYRGHIKKLKKVRSSGNTATHIGVNTVNQKREIAMSTNDPGLVDICQKISGIPATKLAVNKTMISQLDDKFSNVSFKPNFSIYDTGNTFTGTTAGVTTNNCTWTINPFWENPVLPTNNYQYNGMTYCQYSHCPGALASTNTVIPTIAAYAGCTPTGWGPAAPQVFSGIIANGVIGDYSTNNPAIALNNAATAIEASLGNLESPTIAAQAGVDTGALGVTPQAGFYAFYYLAARQYLEPMMAIFNSLVGFINEMSIIADIHYGFIAFNDNIGAGAGSLSAPINNLSSLYNFTTPNVNGGLSISNTYPLPLIPLNPTTNAGASNQVNIINIIPTLSVWGDRNVTQALTAAASQFQTNGRPGANQAILLITSGPPSGSDSSAAATAEAATIGAAGVPIYVICCSLGTSNGVTDDAAYTDANTSGIAGASGHGAKYYHLYFVDPTTTSNSLVTIFGNMARRLVSLMPSS